MKVMMACLADHAGAEQVGNKLNVNGIFDRIMGSKFPMRHAKMFLVFRLMFEYEDGNKSHKVTITLRDADGKEYQRIEANIETGAIAPGDFVSTNQIIELADAVFVKAGRYHFGLKADDEPEVGVPFEVAQT